MHRVGREPDRVSRFANEVIPRTATALCHTTDASADAGPLDSTPATNGSEPMTTTTYVPSDADRAPLPESYRAEPRYLGYREPDAARPFAKYFRDETDPIQAHVRDACSPEWHPLNTATTSTTRHVCSPARDIHMETGWTRLDNGVTAISCRTDMPGVTAAMWDWWFGWLGGDSARYKLWCPDAHQFIAVGDDRSADR